jgi:hypothetical protein
VDEAPPAPLGEVVFDLKVEEALEREPIMSAAVGWVVRVGDDGAGEGAVVGGGVSVGGEDDVLWFEDGAESDGAGDWIGVEAVVFVVGHGHKGGLDGVGAGAGDGGFATLEAG